MRNRMVWLVVILLISSLGFTGIVNAKDNQKMKRTKIRGTVERVEGREAVVRTTEGRQVRVMIGPESYWEDRGYQMTPGEIVAVSGWYPEDNHDSFFAGSISGPGFSFSLTNSSGMPYWVTVEEQHRMRPSYVVYHEWYGPQYNYTPPQRSERYRRAHQRHGEQHQQDRRYDGGDRDHRDQ